MTPFKGILKIYYGYTSLINDYYYYYLTNSMCYNQEDLYFLFKYFILRKNTKICFFYKNTKL